MAHLRGANMTEFFKESNREPLPKPAYIMQYTSSVIFVHSLDSGF